LPLALLPALLDLSLWDVFKDLKPVPLAVIALLVLFSLLSWTIVFSKWGLFRKADHDNRSFLRAFRKSSNLQSVALASEQFSAAPLVAVFDFGYGARTAHLLDVPGRLLSRLGSSGAAVMRWSLRCGRVDRGRPEVLGSPR